MLAAWAFDECDATGQQRISAALFSWAFRPGLAASGWASDAYVPLAASSLLTGKAEAAGLNSLLTPSLYGGQFVGAGFVSLHGSVSPTLGPIWALLAGATQQCNLIQNSSICASFNALYGYFCTIKTFVCKIFWSIISVILCILIRGTWKAIFFVWQSGDKHVGVWLPCAPGVWRRCGWLMFTGLNSPQALGCGSFFSSLTDYWVQWQTHQLGKREQLQKRRRKSRRRDDGEAAALPVMLALPCFPSRCQSAVGNSLMCVCLLETRVKP